MPPEEIAPVEVDHLSIRETMGSWLGEPYFTDEGGIHANARGQQILAEAVAKALVRLYGPQIGTGREPTR